MKPSQILPLLNAGLCGGYLIRFTEKPEPHIALLALVFGFVAVVQQMNLFRKEEQ